MVRKSLTEHVYRGTCLRLDLLTANPEKDVGASGGKEDFSRGGCEHVTSVGTWDAVPLGL